MRVGIIGTGLMSQGIERFFNEKGISTEVISGREIIALSKKFSDVSFIIETTNEDINKKVDVLLKVPKKTRLFTNTSSLSLDELKERSGRPDLGLIHFMNPAHKNNVVEVYDVPEDISNFLKELGKELCPVPLLKGFIVNRILFAQIKEAANLVKLGLTEEYIDSVYKSATKSKVGPFEIKKFIGKEISEKIIKNIWNE